MQKVVVLKIEGMTCDGCADRIRKILDKETGIIEAKVSSAEGKAVVRFDPKQTTADDILNSRAFKTIFRVKASNGKTIIHRYNAVPLRRGGKSRSLRTYVGDSVAST